MGSWYNQDLFMIHLYTAIVECCLSNCLFYSQIPLIQVLLASYTNFIPDSWLEIIQYFLSNVFRIAANKSSSSLGSVCLNHIECRSYISSARDSFVWAHAFIIYASSGLCSLTIITTNQQSNHGSSRHTLGLGVHIMSASSERAASCPAP
jgi:hypothetical protein